MRNRFLRIINERVYIYTYIQTQAKIFAHNKAIYARCINKNSRPRGVKFAYTYYLIIFAHTCVQTNYTQRASLERQRRHCCTVRIYARQRNGGGGGRARKYTTTGENLLAAPPARRGAKLCAANIHIYNWNLRVCVCVCISLFQ